MEEPPPPPVAKASVLFRSKNGAVWLLDLPASIEDGQTPALPSGLPSRRLISTAPPQQPFPTPEPKSGAYQNSLPPAAQVRALMTISTVDSALEELGREYCGPWCLPRVVAEPTTADVTASQANTSQEDVRVPVGSHYISGSVQDTRDEFLSKAPKFDLIVLDPPWPNRSARRKKDYSTVDGLDSIRDLLSLLPIASKLKPDGIVAIWVTNREAFAELLASPRGIFAEWGVELVDTWTWLKITSAGDPIFDVHSAWRKPWEQLFIAVKVGSSKRPPCHNRVVVSVPDAHSRKPNLKPLFEELLPGKYTALEIFARNLTAGWWSWGDEVLHFQSSTYWTHELSPEP